MITLEQKVIYEKKISDVVYVIKSESLPDTKLDMVDAIIVLIKRIWSTKASQQRKSELSQRLRMDIQKLL